MSLMFAALGNVLSPQCSTTLALALHLMAQYQNRESSFSGEARPRTGVRHLIRRVARCRHLAGEQADEAARDNERCQDGLPDQVQHVSDHSVQFSGSHAASPRSLAQLPRPTRDERPQSAAVQGVFPRLREHRS